MKVFLIDDNLCYAGQMDIDPMGQLPRCVLIPPPETAGQQVAQFSGSGWVILEKYPERSGRSAERLREEIVEATQQRLDTFVKTRNYDGILSACSYATSTVPKFQAEGQYCVAARDTTWAALYQIMGEVEGGARPMPSGYADVEPDLPPLAWPE